MLDDLAAIEAWQRGDEQGVHAVFLAYYPKAVRQAILAGLTPDEAQDRAQEAFLHAYERRHQLRDPKAFPLWFHRIVTRCVLDAFRLSQREHEVPFDHMALSDESASPVQVAQPDEEALLAERRAQLWRHVRQLAPQYRMALVLRYYSDFSIREVAALMEMREGTVRVIVHRALAQLRLLAYEDGDGEQRIVL